MHMGGAGAWSIMRSVRRDESVTDKQLPRGILRRIARFAAPYRALLAVFLVLIIVDALVSAANPLLYRAIIDRGIGHHDATLIVTLALIVGGLAVADAGITLVQRWISARIGEGLIYDMRTRVFDHIGRMPLA